MLDFVIVDDENVFANQMRKIIESFMMNYDTDYTISHFKGYGKEFENHVMEDNGFKILFFDVRTEIGSGLDAARYIREELDDWLSIIIIVTSFSQYRYEALSNRLYLLDFVNKYDNCEERLKKDLISAMKNFDNRQNALKYEYNRVIKQIEFRHIIYIEKELDSKRCIIKTTYGDHHIPKTLNEVYKMLDRRFLKVHRSMIVNLDQISEYDEVENKITFKNGSFTNLIARDKKKELVRNVKCNNN